MATHHEPIVLERIEWRITRAECSCGHKLELGKDSGSTKEQAEKLATAFKKHRNDRAKGPANQEICRA